ncbi:helix-turn-helix transcriptional regulator [Candidatus Peregrinibacteria bacterium]|nr:MAG: helix-turn-helix transcriptional regulator [Candidatus Peregrinibacteria bacterium]
MEENNQTPKTIGQKIRIWRKKRKLTQEGLARKADIPYTTLAKIESDNIQNPTLDTITKIANGLEITLNELTS